MAAHIICLAGSRVIGKTFCSCFVSPVREIAMWHFEKRKWLLVALVLLLAVFFGFLTLRSVHQYLDTEIQKVEAQNQLPTLARVVFNRKLSAGTVLNEDDLAIRELPAAYVSTQSLAPEEYEQLVGQMLKYPVEAGEPAVGYQVEHLAHPAFSQRLQTGGRAVRVALDRIKSVGGLMRPGDLVDIYVSFDYRRGHITGTLLQGVYVLARDQTTQEQEHTRKGITTLTLDLDPEDAAKLVAAKQSAEITAMLRNPIDDDTSVKAVRNDIATLLGLRNPIENLNQGRRVNIIYGNTHQGKDTVGPLRPDRVYRAPPAVFDLQVPFHLSHGQSVEGYEWQAEMDLMSEGYE